MNAPTWTRRYQSYARSRGMTPDVAWQADCSEWPLAHMIPFAEWVRARKAEWDKETDRRPHQAMSERDQDAFDEWLEALT